MIISLDVNEVLLYHDMFEIPVAQNISVWTCEWTMEEWFYLMNLDMTVAVLRNMKSFTL